MDPPRPAVIPPAECQQDPTPVPVLDNSAPLPPPAQAVAHARAVADRAIGYADQVRTHDEDQTLVRRRCAAWARQTAHDQTGGIH